MDPLVSKKTSSAFLKVKSSIRGAVRSRSKSPLQASTSSTNPAEFTSHASSTSASLQSTTPSAALPLASAVVKVPQSLATTATSPLLGLDNVTTPHTITRDLWERAALTLPERDRNRLNSVTSGQKFVIEDLLSKAESISKLSGVRARSFKVANREVSLNDIFSKAISYAATLTTIGDIVVQYDPGHMALPWAAFRFILQISTTSKENRELVCDGLDTVTNICDRCDVLATLYLDNQSTLPEDNTKRLELLLIKLYTSILRFFAEIIGYFAGMIVVRATKLTQVGKFKSLLEIMDSDEREFLVSVSVAETQFQRIVQEAQELRMENLQQMIKGLEAPILRTDMNVQGMMNLKMLKWISTIDHVAQQIEASTGRASGTCEWLLDNSTFKSWQQENYQQDKKNTLWLSGDPGTGKTFLTSKVVESLVKTQNRTQNQDVVAYFYCVRDASERPEPKSIFRSILKQLFIAYPDASCVLDAYQDSKGSHLAQDRCLELVVELLRSFSQTTIVIDALDEIPTPERLQLLNLLDSLGNSNGDRLKIFVSSRPSVKHVERLLGKTYRINIMDNTQSDISKYIEEHVAQCISTGEMLEGEVDDKLREHIISTLTQKAGGMFLWAGLQIKQLCRFDTEKELRTGLETLPRDLEETYTRMYQDILLQETFGRECAFAVFRWTLASNLPLKSQQLLEALRWSNAGEIPKSTALVLTVCHNFILHDRRKESYNSKGIFKFAHLSMQEFLEKKPEFHVNVINLFKSTSCLKALIEDKSWKPSDGSGLVTFREHATLYWLVYVRRIISASSSEHHNNLLEQFFGKHSAPSDHYISALTNVKTMQDNLFLSDDGVPLNSSRIHHFQSKSGSPLPLIVYFGLLEQLQKDDTIDLHFLNNKKQSLVYLASLGKQLETLRFVLQGRSNVHDQAGEGDGCPLRTAAVNDDVEMAKLLLKHGANAYFADSRNAKDRKDLQSALDVRNIEGGIFIIDKCKWREQNVDFPFDDALTVAAGTGKLKLVQILLNEGIKVNALSHEGSYDRALMAAVETNKLDVVEFMINEGANVNSKDIRGKSPLFAAVKKPAMIELLIRQGADVNIKWDDQGSVLHRAVALGNLETIQLLLDAGANVDATDSGLGTPLRYAATCRRFQVVEFLLRRGVDVKPGGPNETVLQAALMAPCSFEIFQMLLNAGADIHNHTNWRGNALNCAASAADIEIVQFLLDNGADVNTQGGEYGNPLQTAAAQSRLAVTKLLLANGANISAEGGWYGHALDAGAASGNLAVVELLLQHGANVNAKGGRHGSALQAGAAKGHLAIVKLLLQHGADVNAQGGSDGNALMAAAYSPNAVVLQFLLDSGAELDVSTYGKNIEEALLVGNPEADEYDPLLPAEAVTCFQILRKLFKDRTGGASDNVFDDKSIYEGQDDAAEAEQTCNVKVRQRKKSKGLLSAYGGMFCILMSFAVAALLVSGYIIRLTGSECDPPSNPKGNP